MDGREGRGRAQARIAVNLKLGFCKSVECVLSRHSLAAAKQSPAYSPSPDKQRGENMQDPSYRSPPQKKFSSPQRSSAMSGTKKTGSPSKNSLPFGKPLEIIKSKYR